MGKNNHPGRLRPPCFVLRISTATMGDDWRAGVRDLLNHAHATLYTGATEGVLCDADANVIGRWTYRP